MDAPIARLVCYAYIDGFNFYYACAQPFPQYKWLNFRRFIELLRPNDDIRKIKYFTALVKGEAHHSTKRDRQKRFWRALQSLPGLEIIQGKLIERDRKCKVAGCTWVTKTFKDQQEKRTDVNIAINMVADALIDSPDIIVLISGDTDLIPAIEMIKRIRPGIRLAIYIPAIEAQFDYRRVDEYRSLGISVKPIPEKYLKMAQFPDTVPLAENRTVQKPTEWS